MLTNITGQGYWAALVLFSASCYLIYLFYRKDFNLEFTRRKPAEVSGSSSITHIAHQPFSPNEDEEFTTSIAGNEQGAYACMDALAACFKESKRTKCVKQELLFAVQRILSRHPSLRDSEFQEAITKIIVSEAKHHCFINLNKEEMRRVWFVPKGYDSPASHLK